jgi:hypothetical protein
MSGLGFCGLSRVRVETPMLVSYPQKNMAEQELALFCIFRPDSLWLDS